tara:strand:- start:731 stop:1135 length:405 start_codon:yes stop_codon:yes gene_type:complete
MKNITLIILANYYKAISKKLIISTKRELKKKGMKCSVIEVSGIFEIPVVISKYLTKYNSFIALGCVIKGETPHFDLISKSTFDAIIKLSVESKKPIGNGIITCLNKNQANVRSLKKGKEAVNAIYTVIKNEPRK